MQDNFDLDQTLETAMARHEAGDLDQAEAGYRTVLRHDPDELDALNLLGVILLQRGDIPGAVALFEHAVEIDPAFPEALTNLAQAHRLAGNPAAAAASGRQAIAADPDMGTACLQLGLALIDLGENEAAVETLRDAAGRLPRSADVRLALGIALTRTNDLEAAVTAMREAQTLDAGEIRGAAPLAELARKVRLAGGAPVAEELARLAIALDPEQIEAQTQLGLALTEQAKFEEAIQVLWFTIEATPDAFDVRFALGTALTNTQEYEAAVDVWRGTVARWPGAPALMMQLAKALLGLERVSEALDLLREAEPLAVARKNTPLELEIRFAIANALLTQGNAPASIAACRDLIALQPDWVMAWLLLGHGESLAGHNDAAADAYREVLKRDPGSTDALAALVTLGDRGEDETAKAAAETVLNDPGRPIRSRIQAGFVLAQIQERRRSYDEAFAAYLEGNTLRRREQASRGIVFDRRVFTSLVDGLIARFTPETFAAAEGWGNPSEVPVFIVGLPRSGTSLVEQIAASHPRVFGAGELQTFGVLAESVDPTGTGFSAVDWDRTDVADKTAAYLDHLSQLSGGADRVVDKLPFNDMMLGYIAILFPKARVVLCRRDPRDVALSCFFQNFAHDELTWTCDLGDCGFRAREATRLWRHWRDVLPIPVLEMQYETLVANFERESRRLIDFLGLEWDPACLAFHETERTVATASHWQVRQPIYRSSAARWRRYESHLGPLLKELATMPPEEFPDADPV